MSWFPPHCLYKMLTLSTHTACFPWSFLRSIPNNEVGVGLLHDEFLWADVLLLPGVHNVPLLQDLHGKGFVLITLELNLQREGEKQLSVQKVDFFFAFTYTAAWTITKTENRKNRNLPCCCYCCDSAVPPTSSTRPKPPTPRVSMMLKSARLRLKKNAFSASYLWSRGKGKEA